MDYYIKKPIPVQARLFQPGDEDGYLTIEKGEFDTSERRIPYVNTLEGRELQGEYGQHYLVFGNHGDKWLVKKDIFEETYELINKKDV
jgi:hypothetical protein